MKSVDEGVKAWLGRSGSLTLSISYIWNPHRNAGFVDSDLTLILKTIVEFSHRWGNMRFCIPLSDTSNTHSPLLVSGGDVPLLKSIVILDPDADELDLNHFPFLKARSIRGVSLRCPFHATDITHLLSLNALCHLSLSGDESLTCIEVHDILHQCPHLETCIMRVFGRRNLPSTVIQLFLGCLHRLSIIDDDLSGPSLFAHIAVPNLQVLEYRSDNHFALPGPPAFPAGGAPAELTTLGLSGSLASDVTAWLRVVPALRKLVLHTRQLDGSACRVLPLLTAAPFLCPRLRNLCCLGVHVCSDHALLALIRARGAAMDADTFERVHIAFPRERGAIIRPHLPKGPEIVLR
ncbi:hypothetical protein C8R43DRAFT_1235134 [Mycena crocata]|nr:hypothetical protein C8R43DRAFT_1235134 [Mycena crocata]